MQREGQFVRPLSTARLYALRAMYAFMAIGLLLTAVPGVIQHPTDLDPLRGVVRSVLAAIMLLAILGIRYPVRMLPLLFFEFTWKSIWMLAFFVPRALAHQLNPDVWDTFTAVVLGVVLCPLVIPWGYVVATYLKAPGDRWRGSAPDPGAPRA